MRPRIRTLKPETWADERIGDLCHSSRLLWIGLITMADDEGRLRELPAAILGHIFPYDDISTTKLNRWLVEVEESGMIMRYQADGKRYIAFRHWTRHQKVDRPRNSELPPPPSTNNRRNDHEPFDDDSSPTRTRASRSDPDPDRGPLNDSNSEVTETRAEQALFDYWRDRCDHPAAKLTADRRAKITARLRDGYTPGQIRAAIDGAALGAFVSNGRRFDDIELICRNGSKLESFIGRTETTPVRPEALERMDAWKRGYTPEELAG